MTINRHWLSGLVIVSLLTACNSAPSTDPAAVQSRIARMAERKAKGVYYEIDDKINDNKGDVWEVSGLKFFRESGNVYTYLRIRVDLRFTYAISKNVPLTIKVGSQTVTIPNDSEERKRVGLYKLTDPLLKTLTQSGAQLVIPLDGQDSRILAIEPNTVKGWQAVHDIPGPNEFKYATKY